MLTGQKSTGSMLSSLAILISCLILVSDCGVTTDGGHCDRESEGGDCQHSGQQNQPDINTATHDL